MLDINNAYINTIDANIICRKYMHRLQDFIFKKIVLYFDYSLNLDKDDIEELNEIYDEFTNELDEESECGINRDWCEITDNETITENQIKKIYYELRKNKDKLSFCDADNIIKILCDYNK